MTEKLDGYARKSISDKLATCSEGPSNPEIDAWREKHSNLVRYLLDGVQESDWHRVSDAANDLRVLEARKP